MRAPRRYEQFGQYSISYVAALFKEPHFQAEAAIYFQLKPLGPTRIKGVSEPVNVYEVTGLGPLRTRRQSAESHQNRATGTLEPYVGKA